MRKQQQKQILEMLDRMREAQSAKLYADARDSALAAGGFIRQIAGEGTKTAEFLTEYGELLLKASSGEIGEKLSEKLLRKYLYKIDNSVRFELKPDRIEIVFLCYNASMSDSVLSIYQAAKADPTCDAVWLPIPWYEKNPDGSLGAMHCEGAEHYPNIDCADWRKYDIEARRPDIIVTYNPYDETNYVTSVHPAYYTKRLRELTDLLLYVPYFVSGDNVPAHFAAAAGCAYAHKVAVQSQKVRDLYIRGFKEAFGDRLGKPQDKFVDLGSPKFDMVLSAKRENIALPDSWERLTGKTGENRKKIVLYNTSLSKILEENEKYLKKLLHVLEVFHKRYDVVLLWRPHPLSEATFSCMRPQLLAGYKKIVEEYKRGAWGIYDDSTDLHRAIAVSDAYYGDGSSLVLMYGMTGKPTMMQDVNEYAADVRDYSIPIERDGKSKSAAGICRAWHDCVVLAESFGFSLNAYLDFIVHDCDTPEAQFLRDRQAGLFKQIAANSDGTAGQAIYDYIKGLILGYEDRS